MTRGRIIRILDRRTVVLNIGAQDGVRSGMRFAIHTPREDIIDPQSNENLGSYRLRKAIVVAKTVSNRFTVANTAPVTRRTAFQHSLAAIAGQSEDVDVDLPVDPTEIQPLGASHLVTVGDTVEEIEQKRVAPPAPAAPRPSASEPTPPGSSPA